MPEKNIANEQRLNWVTAYRLRWKRRRLLWRSFRSRHQLAQLNNRTDKIRSSDILAIGTLRNEMVRLPHFLNYYRQLGVGHFLIVDNGSDDGSDQFLCNQPDVSVWQTSASYKSSRFGLDWTTWLQIRYGHGHWTLTVDVDELLVYAHHETRDLHDLTDWLQSNDREVFGAHMLDLYPKGPVGAQAYSVGDDPIATLGWFDATSVRIRRQNPLGNLWVQGGPRERVFFADTPDRSPTLNKIPLIKWNRRFAYVNSTHSALPRRLNFAYDGPGSQDPSGVLLHTKFLPDIVSRSAIEKSRAQHFHTPQEFNHYYDDLTRSPDLWHPGSVRYEDWKQLEDLGLLSSGGW